MKHSYIFVGNVNGVRTYIENVNGVEIEVKIDTRKTTLKGYVHHDDATPREDFENVVLTSIGKWYASKMSEHFFFHAPDNRDAKTSILI